MNREDEEVRHEVILPATAAAATHARMALDEAIPPPRLDDRHEDARLAISEVVTNAVQHGSPPSREAVVRLVIEADEDRLLVEVEQSAPLFEAPAVGLASTDGLSAHGHGLRLVTALADAWGVKAGPPGIVWFEVRR
jgi:anti-sigma regulatory factor (Ser/Thr protein kinase)